MGDDKIFVINGFYMSMREKFTLPDAKLHYFVVEWESSKLSWEDFRGKMLGATDPVTAEDGSLRKQIFQKWEELGLKSEPNVGDNGMHASASPFEAMAERLNWLSGDYSIESDEFAQAMIKAGIAQGTVEEWTKDPQVSVDGKKASIFDTLEDMDSAACLTRAAEVAGASGDVAALEKNQAFVFIKPHAVTDKVVELVKSVLGEQGFAILTEGTLDGPTIGEKKLIDNHYYAIAVKASLTLPKDLNPPESKQADFAEKFGLTWAEALEKDQVFNALDGCTKLALSGSEMDTQWAKTKKAGNLVKFGGGFYAGLVDRNA